MVLKMTELLLLDLLQLSLLRLQFLANDSSFLQVIKPVLLLDLLVLLDLRSELLAVGLKNSLLLLLDLLLPLSLLLLLLDDSEELISLLFGLLSQQSFLLLELALSSSGHLVQNFNLMLLQLLLLQSLQSLALLERSFGPQRIDLGLSVRGSLLKLSESLDLLLLLSLGSLDFIEVLLLSLRLETIVVNDLLLQLLLLDDSLLFDVDGFLVGHLHLCHQNCSLPDLLLRLLPLLDLQVLALLQNKLLLPFLNLSLLDPLHLSLLNLINYDQRPLSLGVLSLDLPFLLVLEALESLDLHHEVHSLLLSPILLLQPFLLLQLPVPDGHALRVDHHLIHVLNVVLLLVELGLRLLEDGLGHGLAVDLVLVLGDLHGPLLVQHLHLGLPGLRVDLLLLLLLAEELLVLDLLLLGQDLSRALDPVELGLRDDDSVHLDPLLSFLPDLSNLRL